MNHHRYLLWGSFGFHHSSHCCLSTAEIVKNKPMLFLKGTNEYLLQLLMPPVLADNPTMKNHGGREETEQHWFPPAALHKRLEVRVQLQEQRKFVTQTINWSRDAPLKPSGTAHLMSMLACTQPPPPALTVATLMSNIVSQHAARLTRALHLSSPHAAPPCCPRGPQTSTGLRSSNATADSASLLRKKDCAFKTALF